MTEYRTSFRNRLTTRDKRTLAGLGGAVVVLHVLGFLGIGTVPLGIGVLAYLVGVRRAFDPANVAMIGDRRWASGGFWFAYGYTVATFFLLVVLTAGFRGLVDVSWAGLFVGLLGVVSVVVTGAAIARSRRGPAAPDMRLRRWVRLPWQLAPVGAFYGIGSSLVIEAGLLVLAVSAAGGSWSAAGVLAILFAAGMCLAGTVQGVSERVALRAVVIRVGVAAVTVAVVGSLVLVLAFLIVTAVALAVRRFRPSKQAPGLPTAPTWVRSDYGRVVARAVPQRR